MPRRSSTFCLLALLFPATAVASLEVTSVAPPAQRVDVDETADIIVVFSSPVDTLTVGPETFRVFGRWSGPAAGTYSFRGAAQVRFTPDEPFFAGEWVTVSVARGVTDAGSVPMARSYTWNFWIRSAPATLMLTYIGNRSIRELNEGWIQSYGAYAGDLDNDGYSDLAVPNELTNDLRVFLNDGTGAYPSFATYPLPGASIPSANEGADFNHDNEIDMVVANGGNDAASVMMGDGTGAFTSGGAHIGASTIKGVAVLDLDGDGWDDFVTANRFGDNISLFLNDGAGTLPDTGQGMEAGGSNEFSIAAADADNDGLQDVFVGMFNSNAVALLRGDGNGGLVFSATTPIGGRPWVLAAGDVNNDGNVDVVAANSFFDNAGVALGDGNGGFLSYTTYPSGWFPLSIDLGDIDGDGDLDMVTSNYSSADWTLHENVDGVFLNPRTYVAQSAGSCAILHDRDNDGDLDVTGVDELDDYLIFYDNDPPATGVGDTPATAGITLLQNHPNPFNPTTTIRFDLAQPASVNLSVYDSRGAKVATLADREYAAGLHAVRWNGTAANGRRVGSGVYYYRLTTPEAVLSRKMMMLK